MIALKRRDESRLYGDREQRLGDLWDLVSAEEGSHKAATPIVSPNQPPKSP
jgi:hypothetical protein